MVLHCSVGTGKQASKCAAKAVKQNDSSLNKMQAWKHEMFMKGKTDLCVPTACSPTCMHSILKPGLK